MSEEEKFNLSGEFQDSNYKSSFARSIVVNSQYKQSKSVNLKPQTRETSSDCGVTKVKNDNNCENRHFAMEPQELVRLRKNTRSGSIDETRRLSCGNLNVRRSSMYSPRVTDVPVENIVHQSKIETLQWQLKEIEKSREMYRAVMKQVVTFLEKAHSSLELLGNRSNQKVSRSKSEYEIKIENGTLTNSSKNCTLDDSLSLRDFSWQNPKKPEQSPDEIPPEKLSKEAFRLLRTAQSLLSTQEPDLAQLDPPSDIEFLAQLAKEFPQPPEFKPQRATSFSLSPKLILPENDVRISTAFNRKLSLQHNELRRSSLSGRNCREYDSARSGEDSARLGQDSARLREDTVRLGQDSARFREDVARLGQDSARFREDAARLGHDSARFREDAAILGHDSARFREDSARCGNDSARCSVAESDCDFSAADLGNEKGKEKSNSPATGSISSVEDESGFSSMNSFQDVGLPLINSTLIADEVSPKNALLRSMLHNTSADYSSLNSYHNYSNHSSLLDNTLLSNSSRTRHEKPEDKQKHRNVADVKLWQKPANVAPNASSVTSHPRWNSAPPEQKSNQPVKVLWV